MKIHIHSHPRSGTHYLAALIDLNFLHTGNYIPLIKNHALLNEKQIDPEVKYIYIWREFEAVAQSIFTMHDRFGLKIGDYHKFQYLRYCDMWTEKTDASNIAWNTGCPEGNAYLDSIEKGRVSTYFKGIRYTPWQWWQMHKKHFEDLAGEWENILIINYEGLKNNFNYTMIKIDCFLNGINNMSPEYQNINTRRGWYVPKAGQTKGDTY